MKHLRRVKLLALSAAVGAASLIVTALPAQAGVTPTPIQYYGHVPRTYLWQASGCGTLYVYGTGFNPNDYITVTLHNDGGVYSVAYPPPQADSGGTIFYAFPNYSGNIISWQVDASDYAPGYLDSWSNTVIC